MFSFENEKYWEHVRWIPINILVDQWCRVDSVYKEAKIMAILSACERGELKYCRPADQRCKEPINELYDRNVLLIEKSSFLTWVVQFDDASSAEDRITAREKNNLYAIIGGLLFLLLSDKKTRRNQSRIINELTDVFGNVEPFSKSGLEKKMPEIKDALRNKNFDFDERLKRFNIHTNYTN